MKNYNENNLIDTNANKGNLAVKIGNLVFPINNNQSINFYKCTSVDTINHTWTGQKAILNNGIYEFELNITSGLTYKNNGFLPSIYSIYNSLAEFKVILKTNLLDANTVFLLNGTLLDETNSVSDSAILNNGIIFNNNIILPTSQGYAKIQAGTLPNNVLCDNCEWTLEISVNITLFNNYILELFGKGSNPRGDIWVKENAVGFNYDYGNQLVVDINTYGEHLIKVTHSSANEFRLFVDNVSDRVDEGQRTISSRNYRNIDLFICWDGLSYDRFFYPNTINYIRISNIIR